MIDLLDKKASDYAMEKVDYATSCYNPKAYILVKKAYKDGYEQGQKDYQNGLTQVSPKTYLELNETIKRLKIENQDLKEYLKGNVIHNTEKLLKSIGVDL